MFDGNTYFNGVLRSLPPNCSTDVRAMIPYIDTVISGKQVEEELLKRLRLNYVAQEVFTSFTLATRFRQAFYSVYQSYGFSYTSRVFCDALQSYAPGAAGRIQNDSYLDIVTNPGTSQPSPSGFLAQHNGNLSLGMKAMMYAIKVYEAYYLDLVFAVAANSSDSPPNGFADMASWEYQVNSQFSWIQASNPENVTIISRYCNVSFYHQAVEQQYLSDATVAELPDRPRVAEMNKYGGWNINPSNTMFTDGEYDPWRAGIA